MSDGRDALRLRPGVLDAEIKSSGTMGDFDTAVELLRSKERKERELDVDLQDWGGDSSAVVDRNSGSDDDLSPDSCWAFLKADRPGQSEDEMYNELFGSFAEEQKMAWKECENRYCVSGSEREISTGGARAVEEVLSARGTESPSLYGLDPDRCAEFLTSRGGRGDNFDIVPLMKLPIDPDAKSPVSAEFFKLDVLLSMLRSGAMSANDAKDVRQLLRVNCDVLRRAVQDLDFGARTRFMSLLSKHPNSMLTVLSRFPRDGSRELFGLLDAKKVSRALGGLDKERLSKDLCADSAGIRPLAQMLAMSTSSDRSEFLKSFLRECETLEGGKSIEFPTKLAVETALEVAYVANAKVSDRARDTSADVDVSLEDVRIGLSRVLPTGSAPEEYVSSINSALDRIVKESGVERQKAFDMALDEIRENVKGISAERSKASCMSI